MLPAKFGSIWPSSFRGEDFFNISQSETRIALGGQYQKSDGVKMISTARSNYPEILKKSEYLSWSYCPFFIKFSKF
jgi:hypothetical protein